MRPSCFDAYLKTVLIFFVKFSKVTFTYKIKRHINLTGANVLPAEGVPAVGRHQLPELKRVGEHRSSGRTEAIRRVGARVLRRISREPRSTVHAEKKRK